MKFDYVGECSVHVGWHMDICTAGVITEHVEKVVMDGFERVLSYQ